jgi:hypothetical protein
MIGILHPHGKTQKKKRVKHTTSTVNLVDPIGNVRNDVGETDELDFVTPRGAQSKATTLL